MNEESSLAEDGVDGSVDFVTFSVGTAVAVRTEDAAVDESLSGGADDAVGAADVAEPADSWKEMSPNSSSRVGGADVAIVGAVAAMVVVAETDFDPVGEISCSMGVVVATPWTTNADLTSFLIGRGEDAFGVADDAFSCSSPDVILGDSTFDVVLATASYWPSVDPIFEAA